jgi:hypothetical protein
MSDGVTTFLKSVRMLAATVFAVAFGYLACWMFDNEYIPAARLVNHGVEVRGLVVVDRYANSCSRCRGMPRRPPEVIYQAPSGSMYTTALTSHAAGYVRVLLEPANPSNCAILEYGEVYAIPGLMVATMSSFATLAFLSACWFLYNGVSLLTQAPPVDSASEIEDVEQT